VKVIASHSVTIAKVKSLVSVKLLSQQNIQFLKFFLLNRWTTIYYSFHNFVRGVTIVCSQGVTVFKRSDDSFAFKDVLREKLYLVDFIFEEVELDRCLITKINMD
jgi:hypothetical protein